MQDKELFELCKEVYEKIGWDKADYYWHSLISHDMKRWSDYSLRDYKPDSLFGMRIVPLYTSDYLLEKLPPAIWVKPSGESSTVALLAINMQGDGGSRAVYSIPYDTEFRGDYQQHADTPLKALLKLTIALADAGELEVSKQ